MRVSPPHDLLEDRNKQRICFLSAYSLKQHGQKHSFVYLYGAGFFSPSTVWPSDFIFCQFEYSNSHLSVWAIPGSCKCAVVAPVAETLCLQWHNVCFLFGSGVGGEGLAVDKWSQTKVRRVLHIFIEVYIFFCFLFVIWCMYQCLFLLGNVALIFAVCCMWHRAPLWNGLLLSASVGFCFC